MANQEKERVGPDFAAGVAVADLPDGAMMGGHIAGEAVLLARVGDAFLAISAKCTHYGGPLTKGVLSGDTVRCPWHHACFSLRTGEAVRAPAIDAVTCWRTEVSGDRVFVREKLARAVSSPAKHAILPNARFLIVGGGAAGFAAAERLRREGFAGELAILSADAVLPVDRPNLSKDFLAGKAPEDWVFLKPASFYAEHRIQVELSAGAGALDAGKRQVSLTDGRVFGFDKLLLATGAEALRLPIPGANGPHVFTLRSIADSRAIIARAATSKVAVVIGSSFIGLEAAASLIERGLDVHIVSRSARPLERTLGPEFGDFVRAKHESRGVIFHLGRSPLAVEEKNVVLDDGARLEADIVIVGAGVRPRIELAENAGLAIDRGVKVDAFMETTAPGVYAAGDIARFPYLLPGGGDARVEHWVVAERQGQVAAINMLGGRQRYSEAPFFWSQHYDVPINYVGHLEHWDDIEVLGNLSAGDGLVKYRKAGHVVAVASVHRDQANLRAALELERSV